MSAAVRRVVYPPGTRTWGAGTSRLSPGSRRFVRMVYETDQHIWSCYGLQECYAPSGVSCPCGSGTDGHDPGDEDRS